MVCAHNMQCKEAKCEKGKKEKKMTKHMTVISEQHTHTNFQTHAYPRAQATSYAIFVDNLTPCVFFYLLGGRNFKIIPVNCENVHTYTHTLTRARAVTRLHISTN